MVKEGDGNKDEKADSQTSGRWAEEALSLEQRRVMAGCGGGSGNGLAQGGRP